MKYEKMQLWRKMLVLMLACLLMLAGIPSALGDDINDPLKPPDVTSADGNITLHKQAERIGPDEWKVTVSANVNATPVEAPPLEVVFVLDTSNSMLLCPYEVLHNEGYFHNHNDATCPFGDECTVTSIMYHYSNRACEINFGNGWVKVSPNRYDIAISAINNLTDSLPKSADIGRVILSQLHKCIADASITVRVVLHGLTHDVGYLIVFTIVHSLHCM